MERAAPAGGAGRELAAPVAWEEEPLLVQSEHRVGHRAGPRSGPDSEALAFRARLALASLAFAFLLSTLLSAWQGPSTEGRPPRKGQDRRGPGVVGAQEVGSISSASDAFASVAPSRAMATAATGTSHTVTTFSETSVTSATGTSLTVTTFSETSVTTTATVFFEKPPDPAFPEIMYLFMPESEEDSKRMARMKEEIVRYLPPQHRGVRVVPAIVPELWPQGRYDRVEHFGKMLPKAHSECTWTEKADGGLYHQYFYDVARHARTLEACREFCCRAAECKAIRFSPTAVDGPDLQCLLYPRGAEAWSLEQPLYKDYRVHLRGDGVSGQHGEDLLDKPWWETRNLEAARVGPNGEHPSDELAWPSHHCGCSLSHFTMWMDALTRGVENLIIFESDGFPSCLESQYIGGNATDFNDLVSALPSAAPEGWHIILLDKGVFGAEPGAAPVGVIRPTSSDGSRSRAYTLIPWKGHDVAGAAAYMVSRRFLEWFPEEIHARGLVMVDAWINWKCKNKQAQNPNPLRCYSYVVEATDEAKARAKWF